MFGVALSTRDLVKRYGRHLALNGFTLSIPQGAVLGLVGPNGAGKTTWMMTVAGFLRASSGSIDILGRGSFDATIHSGRIAILPQDSELPLEATPIDLLVQYARLQGLSRTEAVSSAEQILKAVNLSDRARSAIRTLSHGMRKRVMLAQCFVGAPELVLLDEPLNGLDPVEQARMRNFIHARRGRQTIVISSHNLTDVEILCTHVAMVEKGRVERFATVKSLTREIGRVAYSLARVPIDRADFDAALSQALPDGVFTWQNGDTLVCTCNEDAAAINRSLLPCILSYADILSVTAGISLEQAVLVK